MRLIWLIIFVLYVTSSSAQKTYFVSSTGNDLSTGTSIQNPWKTIQNVEPGDTYLLKSGDTLYFNIPPKVVNTNKRTVISSYGGNVRPVVCLYKRIKPSAWILEKSCIWKVDLIQPDGYTGYTCADGNVGFLKVDGQLFGNKNKNPTDLANQWDFCSIGSILYVYSTVNPSNRTKSIEVNTNVSGIKLFDGMHVSNLEILGTGGHGISGNNVRDITIKNVKISEIGGSYLDGYGDGTVRYGNGIELLNGCTNCLVQNCIISQVYDSGITMQGNIKDTEFNKSIFRQNIIKKCEQSFEVWIKGGGPGFSNCKFIKNACYDAGFGWSHQYRPRKHEGVHILTYELDCKKSDLLITGNIFYKASSGLYSYLDGPNIPEFDSRNNRIYLNEETPLRSLPQYERNKQTSAGSLESFAKHTGYEKGSKITILPRTLR